VEHSKSLKFAQLSLPAKKPSVRAYQSKMNKVLHALYIFRLIAMIQSTPMNAYDVEAIANTPGPPLQVLHPASSPNELSGTDLVPSDVAAPTVGAVLLGLICHPLRHLVRRWNWKSALLSSLFRATIFFFTNLISGWNAAVGAMLTELVFRGATSGFYGAITESFSEARPAWAATAAAMVALPCMAHSLEFLVHWLRGTPKLGLSIGTSMIFTAFSTAFNLYAMRRGVLTTNGKSGSLLGDLSRIPSLLLSFILAGPRAVLRRLNEANFLQ
jgi:hypothetical protein